MCYITKGFLLIKLAIANVQAILPLHHNLRNLGIGTFVAVVANQLKTVFIIIIIMMVKTMTI